MNFRQTAALLGVLTSSGILVGCNPAAKPSRPTAPVTVDQGGPALRSTSVSIQAASNTTPDAFVRELLRYYAAQSGMDDVAPTPDFLTVSTKGLLDENRRQGPDGPVGLYNADPFCDCQDWTALQVTSADAQSVDNDHADVAVMINEQGGAAADAKRMVYKLLKEGGAWRVEDIISPRGESLRQLLTTPAG